MYTFDEDEVWVWAGVGVWAGCLSFLFATDLPLKPKVFKC